MYKYNIIALIGESGSGKDTILKEVLKKDEEEIFHRKISYTSRPKRDYEVNGKDYYFVDENEFIKYYKDFFELTNFNNWYYGTKYDDLKHDKINIGIFDTQSLKNLLKDPYINCFPIYIKVNDKNRLIRVLKREEKPDIGEIFRRYVADKKDFENIKKYVKIIIENNKETDLQKNVDKIIEIGNNIKKKAKKI